MGWNDDKNQQNNDFFSQLEQNDKNYNPDNPWEQSYDENYSWNNNSFERNRYSPNYLQSSDGGQEHYDDRQKSHQNSSDRGTALFTIVIMVFIFITIIILMVFIRGANSSKNQLEREEWTKIEREHREEFERLRETLRQEERAKAEAEAEKLKLEAEVMKLQAEEEKKMKRVKEAAEAAQKEALETTGGVPLSKAEISKIMSESIALAESKCHPRDGTLKVSLVFKNTGKVTAVRANSGSLQNAPEVSCILKVLSETKYHKFDGSDIPVNNYTIQFHGKTDPVSKPTGAWPNPQDVKRLLNDIQNRSKTECNPQPGTLNVSFVIKQTGDVYNARAVGGSLLETEVKSCIIKVLSEAKFSEFTGSEIPVKYSFRYR